MHIKTIIVDGFKSYATRTEIAGFDPEFNAITGLNGSGKSNILDAICFVLGISNLTQVWHPHASARATHAHGWSLPVVDGVLATRFRSFFRERARGNGRGRRHRDSGEQGTPRG